MGCSKTLSGGGRDSRNSTIVDVYVHWKCFYKGLHEVCDTA